LIWSAPTLLRGIVTAAQLTPPSARKTATVDITFA
jgi:hypothetical protein